MSTITIQKTSIVDLSTDAIVNAANNGLVAGSGVCGAIFNAAGKEELQEACKRYGFCKTGAAVITPGFQLKAKYIIHAVGPIWDGGIKREAQKLRSAYKRSLELAVDNGCKSIGFPLISAGIYGYPLDGAWEEALQACYAFIDEHQDISIDIIFAILDNKIIEIGQTKLNDIVSIRSDSVMDITTEPVRVEDHSVESFNDTENWPITTRPIIEHLQTGAGIVDVVNFHLIDGINGYFSNWYPASFVINDIHYTSAEQYIMHQKCLLFGDFASAKDVLSTDDVARQQDIGRKASGYNGNIWNGIRQTVAIRGLFAKFSQNEELKKRLLETGDAWLVECARSDKVWACGRKLSDDRRLNTDSWNGMNILGFALMEVRERLKGQDL